MSTRDPRINPQAGDIVEHAKTYRHVSTAHEGFVTFQQRQGTQWMNATMRVRLAGWRLDVAGWNVVQTAATLPAMPEK